jgi:serine/threonine protein kinase
MHELNDTTIQHYCVRRLLARGGMAEIYLADDLETDRQVAIKLVHKSNRDYYERFRHEIEVMATLQHKHILPVLDYGIWKSWYYLVTPYIAGGTLNDRLEQGALTLHEIEDILSQLCAALQFAHEHGIVHRDIKPSNVLLYGGHHVYLADFGLAKKVDSKSSLTATDILLGTPDYMAPELAEEPASTRSDIYSLGVLLYQMLTGEVPFKGNTPIAIFLKHLSEYPEPPSVLNDEIPPSVECVVMRALEKNPRRRFQTVLGLLEAYRQALTFNSPEVVTLTNSSTPDISVKNLTFEVTQQVHSAGMKRLVGTMAVLCVFIFPVLFAVSIYTSLYPAAVQPHSINAANVMPIATPTVGMAPPPTLPPKPALQESATKTTTGEPDQQDSRRYYLHQQMEQDDQNDDNKNNHGEGEDDMYDGKKGKEGEHDKEGKGKHD